LHERLEYLVSGALCYQQKFKQRAVHLLHF